MFRDIVVWAGKLFLQMVFWVFVLSVNWQGQTLYDRAYAVFVDNELVYEVDAQLARLWAKAKQTVELTFSDTIDKKTENY